MSDAVSTMADGSRWKPSVTSDTVYCKGCSNAVDTSEDILSYPAGNCPDCGDPWTGAERRSTTILVTAPEAVRGES
jgi:hypothetical protein